MDDRLTYDEAVAELDEVAAEIAGHAEDIRRRNEVIRRAANAHVPHAVIARRLHMGRPTVIKILRASARTGLADGYMSCPCGRGDYHLCRNCPYDFCSVHGTKVPGTDDESEG